MGDHADDAINDMFEMESLRQDYRLGIISEQEAYRIGGIIDEYGYEISGFRKRRKSSDAGTYRTVKKKPSGEGKCPLCGDKTALKEGKFGSFYGCVNFPKCKGSRNK